MSTPFHSIPLHSSPFHSAPFYSFLSASVRSIQSDLNPLSQVKWFPVSISRSKRLLGFQKHHNCRNFNNGSRPWHDLHQNRCIWASETGVFDGPFRSLGRLGPSNVAWQMGTEGGRLVGGDDIPRPSVWSKSEHLTTCKKNLEVMSQPTVFFPKQFEALTRC